MFRFRFRRSWLRLFLFYHNLHLDNVIVMIHICYNCFLMGSLGFPLGSLVQTLRYLIRLCYVCNRYDTEARIWSLSRELKPLCISNIDFFIKTHYFLTHAKNSTFWDFVWLQPIKKIYKLCRYTKRCYKSRDLDHSFHFWCYFPSNSS